MIFEDLENMVFLAVYTLDEALQAVLEFNDESDYSDLSD